MMSCECADDHALAFAATPVVTAITESPAIAETTMSTTLSFNVTNDIPAVVLSSGSWTVVYADQEDEVSHTLASEDDRFTFSEDFRSLTINPVVLSDEGTYTLTATNEAGTDSASIMLDVQCKSMLRALPTELSYQ